MLGQRIVRPIVRPLPPMLVVGVVLQIDLIVFITAAAREIDHVGITRVLRKEHCLLAEPVVIEIVVELAIGKVIRV